MNYWSNWSTYTWMMSRETCLICFVLKWRAVLTILVRLFRIKQVKASKKVKQDLFTKRKIEERETKRVLDYLRKLKLQEIFTTVAIASCVIATRDSLFCKMFSPLFCFEQEKTLKNYSKKLYARVVKEAPVGTDQSQRSRIGLDQSASSIQPM